MSPTDVAGEEKSAPGSGAANQSSSGGPAQKPGEGRSSILETLRKISGILLSMLHSRLDLFASELEEERRRLGLALILGGVLFATAMGAFFSGLLFIIALAAYYKLLIPAAGVLSLILAAIALVILLQLRRLYSRRDKFFHYTLEEVRKDIIGIRRVFLKKGSE